MEPDVVANRAADECDQQLLARETEDNSVWHGHVGWNLMRWSGHRFLLFSHESEMDETKHVIDHAPPC